MKPLLQHCLDAGILTGSRAFQVQTKDSDWDIVITESNVPYHQLQSYNWDVCVDFQEMEDPQDADGVDSISEVYIGSIWGPISMISKYYVYDDGDEELTTINLFIYPDKEQPTVDKFNQVNAYMMFSLTHEQRKHKPTRVKKFIEILKQLKIT